MIALAVGMHELAVLGAAAAIGAMGFHGRRPSAATVITAGAAGATLGATAVGGAAVASFSLAHLFGVFVKIGSVLFGSGYVLLAFLRADLVERLGWLTEEQLIDAVAVGQVTPGPLFTTATFVGYVLGGVPGALTATVGIFLPAFVFVAASGPIVPRIRRSEAAGAALDAVNAASLALIAIVAWQLGRASLVDGVTIAIAAVTLGVLVSARVNSAWLIVAGGLIGFAVQ